MLIKLTFYSQRAETSKSVGDEIHCTTTSVTDDHVVSNLQMVRLNCFERVARRRLWFYGLQKSNVRDAPVKETNPPLITRTSWGNPALHATLRVAFLAA